MARRDQVISVYPELEARFGLSYAVRSGNMLFLSGLVSADDQFRLVGRTDMVKQIETIYARLKFVLGKAGATLENVVSEINFTTDSPALTAAADVRRAIYEDAGAAMPTATAVHVDSLVLEGAMLEVHATAVLD